MCKDLNLRYVKNVDGKLVFDLIHDDLFVVNKVES